MGVRVLAGTADGTTPAAALYDSVTGLMLGPIWEGTEAVDHVEAFLEWLRSMAFVGIPGEIGLDHHLIPAAPGCDGTDARHWPDAGLAKLVVYWRRAFLDADGNLYPSKED